LSYGHRYRDHSSDYSANLTRSTNNDRSDLVDTVGSAAWLLLSKDARRGRVVSGPHRRRESGRLRDEPVRRTTWRVDSTLSAGS